MSALSAYDIQRAKRRAMNGDSQLAAMGPPVPKAEPPPKKAAPKRKVRDSEDAQPTEPTRKSARSSTVRGTKPTAEEIRAREEAEEAERKAIVDERNRIKHAARTVVALSSITDSGTQETLDDLLRSLGALDVSSPPPRRVWSSKPPSKTALAALTNSLSNLSLRGLVKVTPDRVYSLVVHPSTSMDLVFAGDKTGHIGLWDASDAGRNGDEGEERNEGRKWFWEAHQRNAISALKFSPTDSACIYSSSYDCTLRRTNFETGASEEVIDADVFGDENLLHSFDFTQSGNEIWASDHQGGLLHRDLREPIQTVRRWEIDSTKIGCISLNPANPYLAVTAHLKRSLKLWDLRTLSSTPQDGTTAEIEGSLLATHELTKACSSAYFDPSGTRIVATSYDDRIRFWNNLDPKAENFDTALDKPLVVPHDNQTGRYLTVFKAQWATHSPVPHITMGDMMERKYDIISSNGETLAQLFDEEFITAVPAVTASHPMLPGRYFGGTGAGKVSFFGLA